MPKQLVGVDPQKSEHQEENDRFAKIGLEGRGESGNRKPDENRGSCQQRAMAPGEREHGREGANQFHRGKTPAADKPLIALLTAALLYQYIKPKTVRRLERGAHRCDGSWRWCRRYVRSAAS